MPLIELEPPTTLPRGTGILRSRMCFCGVEYRPQSTLALILGSACIGPIMPGFLTRNCSSLLPASSTITLAPDWASRPAIAAPELPEPTTT